LGTEKETTRELERAERTIEYVLAVIIPAMLALMLNTYILFNPLAEILLVATVVVATFMVVPARKVLRLRHTGWSKNTMPQRMITALIGMIYITVASVFAVSLISTSKGLDPQQPLTFAVVGGLLLLLIALMAYSSQNKARLEHSEVRFYRRSSEEMVGRIKQVLESRTQDYKVSTIRNRATVHVKERVVFNISAHSDSAEVIIECPDQDGEELCSAVKESLDDLGRA
jgi:hypothetical protein